MPTSPRAPQPPGPEAPTSAPTGPNSATSGVANGGSIEPEGPQPEGPPVSSAPDPGRCAFGGAYSYAMEYRAYADRCEDGSVISDVASAAYGQLELEYDPTSDVVFLNGPFGPENTMIALVLEPVTLEDGVYYQAALETERPNPYDSRYDPLEHDIMVSLNSAAITSPSCDFQLDYDQSVGFPGGFYCNGSIPVRISR